MSDKLDTQLRGHHPDSPSTLQNSEACAHFRNEQRETKAAEAGTLQHKAAETRNLNLLDDVEQVHAVQRCLDLEDQTAGELVQLTGHPATVIREQYLAVSGDESATDAEGQKWPGITGGYPDVVFLCENLAVVLDWKFGKLFVTPTKDNLQGIAYSLALFEQYPQLTEIKVTFFHPYLEMDENGNSQPHEEYTHVFTREEMPQLELRVRTVLARKREAEATGFSGPVKANPCTNLCMWCAKKGSCPALAALAVSVSEKFAPLTVPEAVKVSELRKPEDYAAAYRLASQIEAWAKEIKRRCNDAALTEDIAIPGYELVRRQEREIKSVSLIRDEAIRFGLTLEEFEQCITLPITKVEAKISEKIKLHGGKAAPKIREFQEKITEAGAVTLSEGYTYLKEVKSKVPVIEV